MPSLLLKKINLIPIPHQIFGCVLLFLMVGLISLFSATGVMGLQKYNSELFYVSRQLICAGFGMIMMLCIAQIPYLFWKKLAWPIIGAQIFFVFLTLYSPFAHFAQGANRWLKLGLWICQPSELAKISVAIFSAHILSILIEKKIAPMKILFSLSPVLLLLILILKQPDLGTTFLVTSMVISLLFVAGIRLRYFLGMGLLGIFSFSLFILYSDYRRRRFFAFLNPWEDPQGSGFQSIQSFLSLHSGKLFGVGLGNGNSKLFFLPEVHTDFIFSLIGEELGFLGASCILLLFAYFFYLLFLGLKKTTEPFGVFLLFGLSFSLFMQIAVNLGGVVGLLPIKGLPLPFISWGRSALLANLAMMGIILNILQDPLKKPTK